MAWSERVAESHDFTRDELDPSRGEALSENAPRPSTDDGDDTLDGVTLRASDDLFGLMERLTRARRFAVAPKLQRVWGDDLFAAHLMQLTEPADWLEATARHVDASGAPRRRPACDRFYFRDPAALRARLSTWWRLGPLYADHPRRPSLVRATLDPTTERPVSDDDALRVSDALRAYREKRIPFDDCLELVAPWTARARSLPVEVAGRWLATLAGGGAFDGAKVVTAERELQPIAREVESRYGTFVAPLVQRVFGDDRFVGCIARGWEGRQWFSFAAPMRFEAPAEAEEAVIAWWRRFGAHQRVAMASLLPVEELLADALAQSRESMGAGSMLTRPELVYLRSDPTVIRAMLKTSADDRATSTATEVAYFVHRFGLDVDGLFELVVNRCGPLVWYVLIDVLAAALRVRSPRVVRHLAPLIRRKGLRPLIEAYLTGEGANAIEGLLDMLTMKGSARKFAIEWLARVAADDRGRATLAALLATRDAKVKQAVEPLLR